jgi:hypothetical protein
MQERTGWSRQARIEAGAGRREEAGAGRFLTHCATKLSLLRGIFQRLN